MSSSCQDDFLNAVYFAQAEYAQAFIQLLSVGAYLGILFDTMFFRGTYRHIHETSILKGVARTLITLIIFSPFLYAVNFWSSQSRFVEELLIVYILPVFISGFVFYAFSRIMFKQCKLVASEVSSQSLKATHSQVYRENLSDFSYDSEEDDGKLDEDLKGTISCFGQRENMTSSLDSDGDDTLRNSGDLDAQR